MTRTWVDDVLSPAVVVDSNPTPAVPHLKRSTSVDRQRPHDCNAAQSSYPDKELAMFRQCVALRAKDVVQLGREVEEHDFFSEHARVLWRHVQQVATQQVEDGQGSKPLASLVVLESLQASGCWAIGSPLEQLWLEAQHADPTSMFAARRVAQGLLRLRVLHGAGVVAESFQMAAGQTVADVVRALEAATHLKRLLQRVERGKVL